MEQKNNELTIEDIHRFVFSSYTHSVETGMLAMFPMFATIVALIEVAEHERYGILFWFCLSIVVLGVLGNILYYRSAKKNKKRIEALIPLTFPNYEKKYHNLLLKAYEEIREKEIGRVDDEDEILLINDDFTRRVAEYQKLVSEAKK